LGAASKPFAENVYRWEICEWEIYLVKRGKFVTCKLSLEWLTPYLCHQCDHHLTLHLMMVITV